MKVKHVSHGRKCDSMQCLISLIKKEIFKGHGFSWVFVKGIELSSQVTKFIMPITLHPAVF